jgi:ketosteroid isomerase-like protein
VSGKNVETVQRIYERWGQGDFSAGVELYDPHVVLVIQPGFPESGPKYGLDALGQYMREDFLRDFAGATIAGEEFIEAGDSVVVRVDQQATGPRSGAPVRMSYFQVWTFRGESVIRIESIMERADALRAAGLADA